MGPSVTSYQVGLHKWLQPPVALSPRPGILLSPEPVNVKRRRMLGQKRVTGVLVEWCLGYLMCDLRAGTQ